MTAANITKISITGVIRAIRKDDISDSGGILILLQDIRQAKGDVIMASNMAVRNKMTITNRTAINNKMEIKGSKAINIPKMAFLTIRAAGGRDILKKGEDKGLEAN